jgi:hypothetical protein
MTQFHPMQMELMRIQQRGATERKEVKREGNASTEVKRSKGATGPEGEGTQHDAVSTDASTMGTEDERRTRGMMLRRSSVISPPTRDKKRMRVGSPKLARSSDAVKLLVPSCSHTASFFGDAASFLAPSPAYTAGGETCGTACVYSDDSGVPAACCSAAGDADGAVRYSTGNAWS